MVLILGSDKSVTRIDVRMDRQNVYDIINGLNILVGMKEAEMDRHGKDAVDTDQHTRYKALLAEMQKVKALFK